MIQKDNSYGDV